MIWGVTWYAVTIASLAVGHIYTGCFKSSFAFCFGYFCAEEKTSADSRLGFLLSMRIRYLQDLGGNHMTKPVVEPVLSTRASFLY